ncbi:hypothetical protein BGX21_007003 [Mortierella sp. AD011]|nr:hypothetical protein BGX21_007003 [Mortierella sp. AD011]
MMTSTAGQKLGAWTPELDELIGRLRSQDHTWEYISLAVGRPKSACSDRFYTSIDPELKSWTPAMLLKLDQMVESGTPWTDIAATFNKKIITCRHQWATLGKGKYRVKGYLSSSEALNWKQHEIEGFWKAWLRLGRMDWKAIAAYIGATNQTASKWTPKEHAALLEVVMEHGLFSDWSVIRDKVKPNLSEDEVEAEYYRLDGVAIKVDPKPQVTKSDIKPHDGWTEEDIQRLNTILMKYSSLPVWTKEAAEHGVGPSEDDYEMLFDQPRGLKKSGESRGSSVESRSYETTNKTVPRLPPQFEPPWTNARVHRLKRLVSQQQQQERATDSPINWSWIADHIGPGIDESMCITMWHSMPERSKVKYNPAKYWTKKDIELLEEGITAYGRGWALIQQNFLQERTIDSIRRKVTNLQHVRDSLVATQREIALNQKLENPDLDVDAFIHDNLKHNPQYSSINRLEELMKQYAEDNGKVRKVIHRKFD